MYHSKSNGGSQISDTTPLLRSKGNDGVPEADNSSVQTAYGCPSSSTESGKVDGSGHKRDLNRTQCLFILTLSIFLTILGSTIADPTTEQYIYQVYTKQIFGNNSVKITNNPCINTTTANSSHDDELRNTVQRKSADLLGYLEILSFIAGAISCLILGVCSDSKGRRPLLLLTLIGHLVHDILVDVIIYWDLDLSFLYLGKTIAGVTGAKFGVLLGGFLCMADVTSTEKGRATGMSLVWAAIGAGTAAAMYAQGVFVQKTGFFYPVLTACIIDLSGILVLFFFLPETNRCDPNKPIISPKEGVKQIVDTFTSKDDPRKRRLLLLVLMALFIGTSVDYPTMKLDILYIMNQPFCMTSTEIGQVTSIRNGAAKITGIFLMMLLHKVMSNKSLAILGALSFIAYDLFMGLATSQLYIYLGASSALATTVMMAAARGMASGMVSAERQGTLQGGMAVVDCICFGAGQLVAMKIYNAWVSTHPGFIYLYFACWFGVWIILLLVYGCLKSRSGILDMEKEYQVSVEPCNGEVNQVTPTTIQVKT